MTTKLNTNQRTVVVGMSGGVDSSLSAALLKEQGYNVIGVYMKNWSEPIKGVENCPWEQDALDARQVADQLEIPFYVANFEKEYYDHVIKSFFDDYQAGITPNPDVLCNKWIKFDALFKYARSLGADFIATGHYARVRDGRLLKGVDPKKDQSYFLWAVDRAVLDRVLFPIGHLEKSEVRAEALARKLVTAGKKDSQGICFIGQADVRDFIASRLKPRIGQVLDLNGRVVGTHEGAWYYTIGQRAGIADIQWTNMSNRPTLYVVATRTVANEITVGTDEDLFGDTLSAHRLSWFSVDVPKVGARLTAKIRYGQTDQKCSIKSIDGDELTLVFDEPQRAITPGQSVVLYDGDLVVGGGIIK